MGNLTPFKVELAHSTYGESFLFCADENLIKKVKTQTTYYILLYFSFLDLFQKMIITIILLMVLCSETLNTSIDHVYHPSELGAAGGTNSHHQHSSRTWHIRKLGTGYFFYYYCYVLVSS